MPPPPQTISGDTKTIAPARRLAATSAVLALAASPLLMPTSAEAAGGLSCRASVSDTSPSQYSNIVVRVKSGKSGAAVRTVVHYKTTDTRKSKKSDRNGIAKVGYYISGSTPGYRVVVDVTVSKGGKNRTCSTSFRPTR